MEGTSKIKSVTTYCRRQSESPPLTKHKAARVDDDDDDNNSSATKVKPTSVIYRTQFQHNT